VLGGIGLQLGAIERHMPELDQAGLRILTIADRDSN